MIGSLPAVDDQAEVRGLGVYKISRTSPITNITNITPVKGWIIPALEWTNQQPLKFQSFV